MRSPAWYARRNEAVKRARGKCWWCGSRKRLEVHHLTYKRLGNERQSDLMVLCHNCHKWVTLFSRLWRFAKKDALMQNREIGNRAMEAVLFWIFAMLIFWGVIGGLFYLLLFVLGVW